MLQKKMQWLRATENLVWEIRQSKDEGRQIDDLIGKANKVLSISDDAEKEKAAERLILEMEQRPIKTDYPYIEPEKYEDILRTLPQETTNIPVLSDDELRERLAGAWTGRACGCLLGIPVEGWYREKIESFLKESGQCPLCTYISSQISESIREKYQITDHDPHTPYDRQMKCWINNMSELPVDDDMNYTVLSLRVLESCGKSFTSEDVAEAWLYAIPCMHTCTAERVAYRNLLHCILPPYSGSVSNPYREWIGAQIRVDFYGYINPGDPRAAAYMAYKDAIVAQTKNGVYAAMYIAALIALMATPIDYHTAVLEALKQVPPKSRLTAEIMRIIKQYEKGMSFIDMLNAIHDKYNEKDPFDWCLAIPNILIIVAVLLHFCDDYSQAICQAVLAGFDTDCNAATVGSIIGYRIGLHRIDSKWTAPVRQIFHSSVYRYERIPIDELVERTVRIIREDN